MNIPLKSTLSVACAALTCAASAAAAPPSAVQIETIAAAEALWRDDALAGQTDRQDGTAFDPARTRVAVTDFDGNGRPLRAERTAVSSAPLPQRAAAARRT